MTKAKKISIRILKITLGTYLFLIASLLIADRFIQFRSTDEEIRNHYARHKLPINITYYEALGRQMRYISTGNDPSKPIILFIHGAPSSSGYYRHFLSDTSLRKLANLIAVDRPGYGYSGFGEPEPDIGKQAAMIAPILDSLNKGSGPVVVVGASYGTPVASRLIMDYPKLADGLLLIAPALAPGEEKTYAISYVLESPFFTWAQPRMLHSANVEKFTHEAELMKMKNRWDEIKVPVIYFQGKNDDLIYTTNALFAKKRITGSQSLSIRMIPNRGHLLVFDEEKRIKSALYEMIGLSEKFYAENRVKQGNPGPAFSVFGKEG
ncbi:MAG: alpha/beta hydrolase [Chitinophagaceae bacterium]|jgi:pimeloyl-ACP methyl ester carboxylesterase|nr:alpha/beta hydrolase [Chitinophagaceae bacterium]